jgi:hypothetical protein
MTETSDTVYAAGWRQGTVLRAEIDVFSTIRNPATGAADHVRHRHALWAIATQDCSLYRMRANVNSPVAELRQVHNSEPPNHEGVHARKFLLNPGRGHYLIDDKPSAFVSPRFLCDAGLVDIVYNLSESRVLALKTWLGSRYDRPAVPDELVPLAKAISKSVKDAGGRELADQVRDVYMQFDEADDTVKFSLYAMIFDNADATKIREWLAECALLVPTDLGVPFSIEALTASQISFETTETSYCADLSQLTWMGEESLGLRLVIQN